MKLLSLVSLMVMVGGIVGLFLTRSLFSINPAVIAGAMAHLSWSTSGLVLAVLLGAVGRMVPEERLLLRRYPEYAAYAARTKRMVPLVF